MACRLQHHKFYFIGWAPLTQVLFCRFHCPNTVRRMKAFSIGRIQQPWVNFIPPIRQGPISTTTVQDVETAELPRPNVDSYLPSYNPEGLLNPMDEKPSYAESSGSSSDGDSQECQKRCTYNEASWKVPAKFSRTDYTASMQQREIERGLSSSPSIDLETQQNITKDYRALHEQVKAQGLYNCCFFEYGKEMIRYSLLFGLFIFLLHYKWYCTSAAALGLFWVSFLVSSAFEQPLLTLLKQQIMFTAHDAGHRGITGNFVTDTLIGAFIADFCCGLSIGWWKSSHNVHHLCTNMPEHDPDIQNVPLFSTAPSFLSSLKSSFYNSPIPWDSACDVLVPYQKYTYYPVMAIARFNLYLLSWLHLLSPRATQLGSAWWTRYVELVFMACYWFIFGYLLLWRTLPDWYTRVAFVLISHLITMILHVQITLSHWGMPTSDLGPGESFAQRQLRTTMDVDCPPWLDFVHGGLQFQAIHHLFPRVPRHNLRQVQVLVREFCQKTKIKYQCHGFVEGNKIVLARLDEVGNMVRTLVQCQIHMAETWDSGLH